MSAVALLLWWLASRGVNKERSCGSSCPGTTMTRRWLSTLFSVCCLLVSSSASESVSGGSCEPIKIALCSDTGYNHTSMPNLASPHYLQADAKYELETYTPLIQSRCSSELRFFLCSVYVPMCISEVVGIRQRVIGPCRPLCQRVKAKCTKMLEDFGFPWPQVLSCSKFPASNDHDHMCMEGHGDDSKIATNDGGGNENVEERNDESGFLGGLEGSSVFNTLQTNAIFMEKVKEQLAESQKRKLVPDNLDLNAYKNYVELLEGQNVEEVPEVNSECSHLHRSSSYVYISHLSRCVPMCESEALFDQSAKHKADLVLASSTAITALGAIFVVLSFVLSPRRRVLKRSTNEEESERSEFEYPKRCIVFIALASLGMAISLASHFVIGRRSVSCVSSFSDPSTLVLESSGQDSACGFIFVSTFFFSSSISSWVTVSALNFALISICNLESKSLANSSALFHVIGWLLPLAITTAALITNRIEGDELTGLCYVGAQSKEDELFFIILPEMVHFCVAFLLVVSALSARILGCWKKGVTTELMNFVDLKTFTVALLYFFAKAVYMCLSWYEILQHESWLDGSSALNIDALILRLCLWQSTGLLLGLWACFSDDIRRVYATKCCNTLLISANTKKSPSTTTSTNNAFPTVNYSRQHEVTLQDGVELYGGVVTQQQQQERPSLRSRMYL